MTRARSTALRRRSTLIASIFSQEGEGLLDAEFLGPGQEGPDVLGQAAAAETDTGGQEPAADAGVVARGLGQGHDVGPDGLADFGDRVDERDLRGQEGVRRRP